MNALARALSTALVDFFWQGALVGLVLWAALVVLRNRPANVRYAVSCLALLGIALLPILTMLSLWLQVAAPPHGSVAGTVFAVAPLDMPQTMLPIWLVPEEPRIVWLARAQGWALPIWSAGVFLFSVRLALGSTAAFRLQRHSRSGDESLQSAVAALARRIGIHRPVKVLVSSMIDGPGMVGWWRPAILLPPSDEMGLTARQLEAVLAHELAHIRRHDYLVNIFQILTETLLFYHPVVWWISRQIRVDRELCCDDIAVRSCGDAVCYARALAILARRRAGAPVFSMAATGGSLVHRIQRVLGAADGEYAPSSRIPVVVVLCLALSGVVLNLDWMQASEGPQSSDAPKFEVASVKPNNRNDGLIMVGGKGGQYRATGISLRGLIQNAYQVQEFQIVGGPRWLDSDRFDIVAKEPAGADVAESQPGPSRQQLMLRGLLAERFNLAVHKETRDMPIFAIVAVRPDRRLGPQLRPSAMDCSTSGAPSGGRAGNAPPQNSFDVFKQPPRCGTSVGPGIILAGGTTMVDIATAFSRLTNTGSSLNRLVIDRSGLEGAYDLELRFTPDRIPTFAVATGTLNLPADDPRSGLPPVDPNGPSIFSAVQEQLGLKLDPQRGPVDVLVIDRVDRPTED
jgi:uncharacterized protein (TIGR03435 family)